KHLPALKDLDRARIHAIYDADTQRARSLAHKWRIENVAPSLEALVTDPAVNAVLVATPNSAHREGVEAAARAGKHVLCEKPLAITMADTRAAIETCRERRVILQIGFHHRFQPQLALARELFSSGILGKVYS